MEYQQKNRMTARESQAAFLAELRADSCIDHAAKLRAASSAPSGRFINWLLCRRATRAAELSGAFFSLSSAPATTARVSRPNNLQSRQTHSFSRVVAGNSLKNWHCVRVLKKVRPGEPMAGLLPSRAIGTFHHQ